MGVKLSPKSDKVFKIEYIFLAMLAMQSRQIDGTTITRAEDAQ
jgi:hypothetical protein